MQVKIKKLRETAVTPTRGSVASAGYDVYACLDKAITVTPGETVKIPTGLCMELPDGYAAFIYARSGLATKKGLAPANKVGICDSDYRGEYIVPLHNHGTTTAIIHPKERIAQLVFLPFVTAEFLETDSLSETERGTGGFGSTGK